MKAKIIIGCSESNSDLYYATKFLAPDDFIYLETERGKKIIYINSMEFSRAQQEAHVDEVIDVLSCPTKYKNVISWIFVVNEITEVVVSEDLSIKYFEALKKARVKVSVKSGTFFKERESKNEEELRHIKAVQKVNEKGMEAAIEILRKSRIRKDSKLELGGSILTSEKVKEVIDIEFLRGGCKSDLNIVSCGRASAEPHNTGSGPLFADKPIIIDLYPRSVKNRYYADMTRTVVRGKASEEIRKIYDLVLKAQKNAIAEVRSGLEICSLENEVRRIFDNAGYETDYESGTPQGFIHSLGHGVGLDIHEEPAVSRRNKDVLKSGNVITIEPGLYFPNIGGVRIEDMISVKDSGCENLTRFPKIFEI